MSMHAEQRPADGASRTTGGPSGPTAGSGDAEGDASFRRTFVTTQGVFLVFALIAAIPETPSEGSVGAAIQVVIIATLWVLTDAVALTLRAARARTMRTRH